MHLSFLASSPPPLIPDVFERALELNSILSPLFAAEDQMYYFPPLHAWWRDRNIGSAGIYGPASAVAHEQNVAAAPAAWSRRRHRSPGQTPGRASAGPPVLAAGAERRGALRGGAVRGSRARRRPAARLRIVCGLGSGSPRACAGVGFGLGGLLLFVVVYRWFFHPQNRSWGRYLKFLHCWLATPGKERLGLNGGGGIYIKI